MAFTSSQLEEITTWCDKSPELAEIQDEARRTYFAEDDPRPVKYWPGAGDRVSRDRRFLGWFLFTFRLPDGTSPAESAVNRLYGGSTRTEALQAVQHTRYVLAIVTSILPGRSVFLDLEHERFEVRYAPWSHTLTRGNAVVAHLIPTRSMRLWIPGPGWLEWPIQLGPQMRRSLKKLQPDPIAVERLLQSRATPEETERSTERPRDTTLAAAVARMTEAAQSEGRSGLVLSETEWAELVVSHMARNSATSFAEDITRRVGSVAALDELNRWLGMAMNIWNTTPQPDRGGRTALELLSSRPKPGDG
jgi:hypothetical protein